MGIVYEGTRLYEGWKEGDEYKSDSVGRCVVTVIDPSGGPVTAEEGRPLPVRLDLAVCEPDGFQWGGSGGGAGQLALALVAHATGDDRLALRVYRRFCRLVVARLSREGWVLTRNQIIDGVIDCVRNPFALAAAA